MSGCKNGVGGYDARLRVRCWGREFLERARPHKGPPANGRAGQAQKETGETAMRMALAAFIARSKGVSPSSPVGRQKIPFQRPAEGSMQARLAGGGGRRWGSLRRTSQFLA